MKRANVRELGPNLEAAEMPPGGRQKISAVVDNIGRNQCTATTEEHAGVHQLALTTIERTVSDYAQVLFLREREIKRFPRSSKFPTEGPRFATIASSLVGIPLFSVPNDNDLFCLFREADGVL